MKRARNYKHIEYTYIAEREHPLRIYKFEGQLVKPGELFSSVRNAADAYRDRHINGRSGRHQKVRAQCFQPFVN